MASRVGARLLTGPLAFLVGGLLDVGTLMLRTSLARARRARRARRAAGPPIC